MTLSACWKYFSLGVEKSPGIVNGPSPYRLTGPRNLCSMRLTMIALNPWRRRASRYVSASSSVRPEMRDHAASPWTRNGVPARSTRYRWSADTCNGYRSALHAMTALRHTITARHLLIIAALIGTRRQLDLVPPSPSLQTILRLLG